MSGDTYTVTQATIAEKDAVRELLSEQYFRDYTDAPENTKNMIQDMLDHIMLICFHPTNAARHFLLGKDTEKFGIVCVEPDETGKSYEISDLYIKPAHRGRDLSRLLLQASEDFARDRKAHQVTLQVSHEDKSLLEHYKRHGYLMKQFGRAQRQEAQIARSGHPTYHMYKVLAP